MVVLLLLAALLQDPVSSTLYGPRFLKGEVGGSITHQCFYSTTPANKHDRKYWCKTAGNGACYTVISTTGYTSQHHTGRVALQDLPQNGTFMVTMRELKKSDTGIYRCGIGTSNTDLYVRLNLTVLADVGELVTTELIQGELHGSVTILCPPGDPRGSERRFWCKLGRISCTLIADSEGFVAKSYQGRISITPRESSGAFKILINDLKEEDSGLYQCGTGRMRGWDGPRVVVLQVTAASSLPKSPKHLRGRAGGSVPMECHYDPRGNYQRKYLCRWKGARCELLVDAAGFVHESYQGRIQISSSKEDQGIYTVVLSHLREEDTGWYWCGAQDGQTEHTASLKLHVQKETHSAQDPEPSTLGKATFKATFKATLPPSLATSSPARQSSVKELRSSMGTVTQHTRPLLPPAPPSTFVTSPGEAQHESSSGGSGLSPVLILLTFITVVVLALTKLRLQKGEESRTIGKVEVAPVETSLNPEKEQPREEAPSLENTEEGRTGPGTHT